MRANRIENRGKNTGNRGMDKAGNEKVGHGNFNRSYGETIKWLSGKYCKVKW
jgi:hypothetical protein